MSRTRPQEIRRIRPIIESLLLRRSGRNYTRIASIGGLPQCANDQLSCGGSTPHYEGGLGEIEETQPSFLAPHVIYSFPPILSVFGQLSLYTQYFLSVVISRMNSELVYSIIHCLTQTSIGKKEPMIKKGHCRIKQR